MGKISLIERQKVIVLHEEGYSQRQISSKTSIQRLLLQKSLKSLEKLAPLKIERKVVDLQG